VDVARLTGLIPLDDAEPVPREERGSGESGDLFYDEVERRLVKLFCIGIKPELTEAKRAQLFREICARLQSNEVQLLNNIFAFRAIPGVPLPTPLGPGAGVGGVEQDPDRKIETENRQKKTAFFDVPSEQAQTSLRLT
jgi:hypothetical protein